MENHKEYIKELDEILAEYSESPGADEFMLVLIKFFEGIIKKKRITCPVEMDPGKKSCIPLYLRKKNGKEHLAFLTEPGGEKGHDTADLDLRSLVKYSVIPQEDCEGIVFNPYGEHQFFIPKELLMYAFYAGHIIIADEEEKTLDTDEEERDEEADAPAGETGPEERAPEPVGFSPIRRVKL